MTTTYNISSPVPWNTRTFAYWMFCQLLHAVLVQLQFECLGEAQQQLPQGPLKGCTNMKSSINSPSDCCSFWAEVCCWEQLLAGSVKSSPHIFHESLIVHRPGSWHYWFYNLCLVIIKLSLQLLMLAKNLWTHTQTNALTYFTKTSFDY